MKPASQLRAIMTGEKVLGTIPIEYMTTDRVLIRWAADSGSGLPTEVWDDSRIARPVPLDDDTWLVVDGCVRKAPPKSRELLVRWYKSPLPTRILAEKSGMAEDKFKKIHILTLHFMKHRLESTGHPSLLRILSALDI